MVDRQATLRFDADFLKQLEYLALLSRRAFGGKLLARRRRSRLGSGIEFADHRDFVQGDDLKHVDWRVFARHGDLLLKRFQEEEDLPVSFLIDISGSMGTGTPSKHQRSCQLAAALAYIALADMDRVALYGYDTKIRATLPMTRGKPAIMPIFRFLESLGTQQKQTDLTAVAREFGRRQTRGGLVVVLSDLFDQPGFQRGIDALRYQRFEPHVLQILSPQDVDPPVLGDVDLVDAETGEQRKLRMTRQTVARYREALAKFDREVQDYCRRYALSHTRIVSDVPFDAVILQMMRAAGTLS